MTQKKDGERTNYLRITYAIVDYMKGSLTNDNIELLKEWLSKYDVDELNDRNLLYTALDHLPHYYRELLMIELIKYELDVLEGIGRRL